MGGGPKFALGLRPSVRGVFGVFGTSSPYRPFSRSVEPPFLIVSLDIMRDSFPVRAVFDDSNEITLAFATDERGFSTSSGGPSSKNAMSSRAAAETCGVRGFPGVIGVAAPTTRVGVLGGADGLTTSSSPSSPDPFITSSKSSDSRFRATFLVRVGIPAGVLLGLWRAGRCVFCVSMRGGTGAPFGSLSCDLRWS